jgi:myo-inositol-1(or 4)-monophosphatase
MTEAVEVRRLLESIAREAGAELLRRFGGPRQVTLKGSIDLVTDADKASEALILERLSRDFPEAAVLAEESGAHAGRSGWRCIVDPLDGTTNYASGLPHFSVTIGADEAGVLKAGVIYDPCRDELYGASTGAGAHLNGARLQVADAPLGSSVLATGFPYDVAAAGPLLFDLFETFVRRSRAVRRFGSAALDLAWTAQGRYQAYYERGVKPWDIAAGLLIVREAGGVCLDYAGREARTDGGEVIAGAPGAVAEMQALIAERSAVVRVS